MSHWCSADAGRIMHPMKAALLGIALLPAAAFAQQATDNAPLNGTWSWTQPDSDCTEIYDFRPDGNAYVISGAERTEARYTLSPKPGPQGRQRLVITATKYHAGKDCAGRSEDATGKPATSYVLFLPGRRQLIMCNDETSDACFGPLFKVNP